MILFLRVPNICLIEDIFDEKVHNNWLCELHKNVLLSFVFRLTVCQYYHR